VPRLCLCQGLVQRLELLLPPYQGREAPDGRGLHALPDTTGTHQLKDLQGQPLQGVDVFGNLVPP